MIAHRYRVAMWPRDIPSNWFVACVHCGYWTSVAWTAFRCDACSGHGRSENEDWDNQRPEGRKG